MSEKPAPSRPEKQPTLERRASFRYLTGPEFPLTSMDLLYKRMAASVQDISKGGLALLVRHEIEAGIMGEVELYSRDRSDCYTLMISVVHTAKQADGSWLLGCKFVKELGDEQLKNLL